MQQARNYGLGLFYYGVRAVSLFWVRLKLQLIMDFHPKQVVWAKVKGYPWWPAYINKLPEDSEGNFKVIFFAEDTYALLQPKCVQKFADNYAEHSKTKAKKFLKALELANSSANRASFPVCAKVSVQGKKKGEKREQEDQGVNQDEESEQSEEKSSVKVQQSQSMPQQQQELQPNIELETEQVDRKKVQKIQNELSDIITSLQSPKNPKEWPHSAYFQSFLTQYDPNSQQLLHSNLTRKLRYIIDCMKSQKIDPKEIQKLQLLSSSLKKKVMDYLTDTTYYDQHLKVIDKSRHNKAEIENSIVRIMRKRYNGQVKRDYIGILATQIGMEVGKNIKFRAKDFTNQLKEGGFDGLIKSMNSKAATQRMADQIIATYRE